MNARLLVTAYCINYTIIYTSDNEEKSALNNNKSLPERVIITDEPLRAKMLNAHHLECSSIIYERRGALAFSGGYNGVPLAVVSTGTGSGEVLSGLSEAIELGAKEIVYIGSCLSTTSRHGVRDVILAAGGSQDLLNKAITVASQLEIPVSTRTVLPPDRAHPEEGCIVESHTGGLYAHAHEAGGHALSILTVSENTVSGEKMEEHEVQSRFYAASRLVFELLTLKL